MSLLKTLQKAMQSYAHGQFKVVTRVPGKIGCSVRLRSSLGDAQAIADKARACGKEAIIYEFRCDDWKVVE